MLTHNYLLAKIIFYRPTLKLKTISQIASKPGPV